MTELNQPKVYWYRDPSTNEYRVQLSPGRNHIDFWMGNTLPAAIEDMRLVAGKETPGLMEGYELIAMPNLAEVRTIQDRTAEVGVKATVCVNVPARRALFEDPGSDLPPLIHEAIEATRLHVGHYDDRQARAVDPDKLVYADCAVWMDDGQSINIYLDVKES